MNFVRHYGLELPVFNGEEAAQAAIRMGDDSETAAKLAEQQHQRYYTDNYYRPGDMDAAARNALERVELTTRTVPIHIQAPGYFSLKRLLRAIHDGNENLAELCGAQVVPHSWGLIPDRDGFAHKFQPSIPSLLPKNYALGVRAAIVAPMSKPEGYDNSLVFYGLRSYNMQGIRHRKLRRAGSRDFTYGVDTQTNTQANWVTGLHATTRFHLP